MPKLLVIGGLFVLAGLFEIGGGYLIWGWLRQDKPLAWRYWEPCFSRCTG